MEGVLPACLVHGVHSESLDSVAVAVPYKLLANMLVVFWARL